MRFFGDAKLKKARKQGKEWIQLARKIDHFRRDVIAGTQLDKLRTTQAALAAEVKDEAATVDSIQARITPLEQVLREVGGSFYPRGFVAENIDMIVVAAIVAIGIRSFFLQPFKIPTNSMFPTYHGLTTDVYFGDERPSAPVRIARVGLLGAGHRTVEGSPGSELILPLMNRDGIIASRGTGRGAVRDQRLLHQAGNYLYLAEETARNAKGMRFVVLPGPAAFYQFIVGDEVRTVTVPADFSMNHVVEAIVAEAGENARIERNKFGYPYVLRTGITVPEGEEVALSFDIKSGDMLFVDRMTYHFRPPELGEPFVFGTTQITGMEPGERGKYYIKRVGGTPGDTLQVRDSTLLVNGEPASGAEAFERNANQEGFYEGYLAGPPAGYPLDVPRTLPPKSYFALGDNSDESSDSRFWGYVPESSLVGKAVIIYYPFSTRWGLAE